MMRNRPEFLEVQAGAGRLGAAAVSVSWRSTAAELVYLAQHCGAKAIVFEADLWHVVEQAKKSLPSHRRQETSSPSAETRRGAAATRRTSSLRAARACRSTRTSTEDAAVVIYTSGTTGKPKGAVRKFPKDAMHASMQFIGETPMRVGRRPPRHVPALPLDGVRVPGVHGAPRRHVGAHGRVQARAVPPARRAPRRHDDGGRADDPPPRDGARPGRPRQVRRPVDARDLHGRRAAARAARHAAHGPLRRRPLQLLRRDRDRPRDDGQARRPARGAGLHRQGAPGQRGPPARRPRQRRAPGRGRRALRAQQDARRRATTTTRSRPGRA